MSGNTNYPTSLDDDTSLYDVTDGVTQISAAHHNNMKESIKALEKMVGAYDSTSPTSLWYRLGSPTDSHNHSGATMMGQRIQASSIAIPSGGLPTGGTLYDHLVGSQLHSPAPTLGQFIMGALATVLPSAITIPGLTGSPDKRHTGALDDDFDAFAGWATLGPAEVGEITTALSHLRIRDAAVATTSVVGFTRGSATTYPFTFTAKLADMQMGVAGQKAGIWVGDATPGIMVGLWRVQGASGMEIQGLRFANPTTAPTVIGTLPIAQIDVPVYLRIIVNSATSIDMDVSSNGFAYNKVVTAFHPSAGASLPRIGLGVDAAQGSRKAEGFFDWINFS